MILAYFVEQQGKDNRGREIDEQIQHADEGGVFDQPAGIGAGKKDNKIVEADPFASQNPLYRREFLEGHQDAEHGQIVKKNKVCENNG